MHTLSRERLGDGLGKNLGLDKGSDSGRGVEEDSSKIFLETARKLMREIPWDPIRKVSLFTSLMIFIGTIAYTEVLKDPTIEWAWWWLWFGLFLTFLPVVMGRVACGWFCPYAAIHDIFFTKLKYKRAKWPSNLRNLRFFVLFGLLGVLATVEIFWEWDFFIWYCRAYLILAVIWGIIFTPRDWCRYVCVLGAYAQIYARIRVLGVRVDERMCLRCESCECEKNCPMNVDWKSGVKERWITPDYCILCFNCVNVCRSGAVYAWRVH